MSLQTDPFVFNCPSRRGSPWPSLKMTAKRYRAPSVPSAKDGLTLLFFHCVGAHKEQWEPVITYLANRRNPSRYQIREAWSFDWPTHGDAAILNRELLDQRTDSVSVYDWVPGVIQFIRSEHVQGHKLVLCGHSAGAATAVHAIAEFYPDLTSFAGLILVESTLITRELFHAHLEDRMGQMDFAVSSTSSRRDRWKSRKDALAFFQKRFPWGMWDQRVIRLLVEHGLYELEDGTVALKCDKKREAEVFPDVDPHFEGALKLNTLCHALPVHAIWGTRADLVPEFIQESLSDPAEGRPMASVTKVEECGHMILQEQPEGLAKAIHDVLNTIPSSPNVQSKL